jgi:multimeric flavodoxin WrbA
MKTVVLHGSPSGANSVTLKYIQYLQQQFPEHPFEIIDVARGIRRLERDEARFGQIVDAIRGADGVLWSFPVYTFLVPAGMARFIELLYERLEPGALAGKLSTAFSTSEHFYDNNAHAYIEEVAGDLGMRVLKGFSAQMDELLDEGRRANVDGFMRHYLRCLEGGAPMEEFHVPVTRHDRSYTPTEIEEPAKTGTLRVTVITDLQPGADNLGGMIDTFVRATPHQVDVVNLHEIDMRGGCLGCLRCVHDGVCVYKDGFAEAFDRRIATADALILAGTLRPRYLSSTFKMYFDRNFKNGHRPILHGKPLGMLLSGPLRQMPNLREILEATHEVQHSPRLGIITDEYGDDAAITDRVVGLAGALDDWAENPWMRPGTFLGVGGRKIFRDLIYGMRGVLSADHAYYRRNGLYDFPQRNWRMQIFNLVLTMMTLFPPSRRWLLSKMGELKLLQFKKIVHEPPGA